MINRDRDRRLEALREIRSAVFDAATWIISKQAPKYHEPIADRINKAVVSIDAILKETKTGRILDIRSFVKALRESGLDGFSHEDGWTLMETKTAESIKSRAEAVERRVAEALRALDDLGSLDFWEHPKRSMVNIRGYARNVADSIRHALASVPKDNAEDRPTPSGDLVERIANILLEFYGEDSDSHLPQVHDVVAARIARLLPESKQGGKT